jgi:folate-binding protein YgfZ
VSEETVWYQDDRDVLRVSGPDAASYLHSQLSQDVVALGPGDTAWSLLLQPTGKVCALARLHVLDSDAFAVDTDAGYGEAVQARLERFRIRVKVDIDPLPWRCTAVRGPDARAAAPLAVPGWWMDGTAVDLMGDTSTPPAGLAERPAAALTLRIAAGWPAMGREIADDTIPAELGPLLDLAVSFTKGCYPGQELVERMASRGASAPRVLRRLEGVDVSLASGTALLQDGREVGHITSAAGTVALAPVSRTVDPGVVVEAGEERVTVRALR